MTFPWKAKNANYIKQLLYTLGDHRRYLTLKCAEVGALLFNLTLDDTYYEHWVVWSTGSEPTLETYDTWRKFTVDTTLDINTLCHWASQDNPFEFFNIQYEYTQSQLSEVLYPFLTYQSNYLDEAKLASIIHQLFQHQLAFVPESGQFYLYRSNYWVAVPDTELFKKYLLPGLIDHLNMNFSQSQIAPNRRYYRAIRAFRSNRLLRRLTTLCKPKFNASNYRFQRKLARHPNLVCFTNGVYDLSTGTFREGRPGDYCHINTKYQYRTFTPTDNKVVQLEHILASILINQDERDYVLKYLATSLQGTQSAITSDDRFCQIWLGLSGDGREFLAKLITYTFGDYVRTGFENVGPETRLLLITDSDDPSMFDDELIFKLVQYPRSIWLRSVGLQTDLTTDTPINFVPFYASQYGSSPEYASILPVEFYQQFAYLLITRYFPLINTTGINRPINIIPYTKRVIDPDIQEAAEILLSMSHS